MSGYIGTQPVPQATQTRQTFTAAAGQTSFATIGYTPNYLDVWLNGVKLVNGTDFTATNGSDVVLTSGAADGDTLEVLAYSTFEVNSQNFTGGLIVNNDGATVLTVDRATSDGTLVDFQKDGTTVGSIGTQGGDKLTIGNGDVGVALNPNADSIYPWNTATNAPRDASMDLGYSDGASTNIRFRNLYLSGGVYLGGTGSANLLDDYEEGTWTPQNGSYSTVNSIIQSTYVKVGNLVVAYAYINGTTTSSNFTITNLPYVSSSYAPAFLHYPSSHAFKGHGYVESGGSWFAIEGGSTLTNANFMVSVTYKAA